MNEEWNDRVPRNRPWNEYPVGTKAWSLMGGHWIRVRLGWKWHNGSTFPTPGADAFDVTIPKLRGIDISEDHNMDAGEDR